MVHVSRKNELSDSLIIHRNRLSVLYELEKESLSETNKQNINNIRLPYTWYKTYRASFKYYKAN